jgi:hypothetical protein
VEDVTEVKGLKTLQKDLVGAVDTGEGRQLLGIVDSSRKGDKLDAIGYLRHGLLEEQGMLVGIQCGSFALEGKASSDVHHSGSPKT